MYAPTFRGGSQGTDRTIAASQGFPDYKRLKQSLETKFGGGWYIFLRLHPQLVARNLDISIENSTIVDISRADDMYEILAGCDAFMTDYSSAAFDAAVMRIPIFLYADDYAEYEGERGKLLWNLRKLPFPLALTNDELEKQILDFNETAYQEELEQLFQDTGMVEDGQASKRVVDEIEKSSKKLNEP
jgi:CDP-glycerol glycerophosphotransferase